MCFVIRYRVIKLELMMFCEHDTIVICLSAMALSYCNILLETFTDSLCSKPPPANLDMLWYKVLFFKTWISVVFSIVFLKKIKNHKFSFFFLFLLPKMSHFFENGSTSVFWAKKRFSFFRKSVSKLKYLKRLKFPLIVS